MLRDNQSVPFKVNRWGLGTGCGTALVAGGLTFHLARKRALSHSEDGALDRHAWMRIGAKAAGAAVVGLVAGYAGGTLSNEVQISRREGMSFYQAVRDVFRPQNLKHAFVRKELALLPGSPDSAALSNFNSRYNVLYREAPEKLWVNGVDQTNNHSVGEAFHTRLGHLSQASPRIAPPSPSSNQGPESVFKLLLDKKTGELGMEVVLDSTHTSRPQTNAFFAKLPRRLDDEWTSAFAYQIKKFIAAQGISQSSALDEQVLKALNLINARI